MNDENSLRHECAGPNQRNVGESLADPTKYGNLFAGWEDANKVSGREKR